MRRFAPGQEVVCAHGYAWEFNDYGPKLYEVVTIDRYEDDQYVIISEYLFDPSGEEQCFEESAFEPVCSISELTSILEQEYIRDCIHKIFYNDEPLEAQPETV